MLDDDDADRDSSRSGGLKVRLDAVRSLSRLEPEVERARLEIGCESRLGFRTGPLGEERSIGGLWSSQRAPPNTKSLSSPPS